MTKPIHLLPFYVKESKTYKISDYCDLSKQKESIRGMKCVKTKLPVNVPVFKDGERIKDEIFYWKQEENENNVFDIGFELLYNKTKEKKIHQSLQRYIKK
ncbi:hypothetical protein BDAP_000558 [Binucleata daphniae]